MAFSWRCPYCNQIATITKENLSENVHFFNNNNKDDYLALLTRIIICPNDKCKEYTIDVALNKARYDSLNCKYVLLEKEDSFLNIWKIKPHSDYIEFPEYVPTAIINDYKEASLIKKLSPKASATLARRCLQGIIRDFWKVKKNRLVEEIEAIKDNVNSSTWQAIDAIRKIGNIGAHMEKDINLIIDVEQDEAELLLKLIEMLISDWYIERHEREKRVNKIVNLSKEKTKLKKS